MYGKRLIRTLRLRNFLSFGPECPEIELEPLTVLIGPNASGKSNFIEALSLLRATPKDLTAPIREGGGVSEWLWKGTDRPPTAEIEATVYNPNEWAKMPLRYRLWFTMVGQRFQVADEAIENERASHPSEHDVYFYYRYQSGDPVLNVMNLPRDETEEAERTQPVSRRLRREDMNLEQSVVSQRKDPEQYPEITYLGEQFGAIALYREWNLGRYTPPRMPQKPDDPQDFLLEDGSNLGLVLNDLEHQGAPHQKIMEYLRKFYDQVDHVGVRIYGGTVQIFLHERGLARPIPATRLSDGTLRYLCLLSILCHPTPPPLVCIEEPELGLHPDIIPTVADLLKEASQRTQLIVATHSDMLVSALSDVPEAVVVCERDDAGTHLRRLDPERLKKWLEDYSLGDLWLTGELGGTRW